MPCRPPYYPCPGHESIAAHDNAAACSFYPVFAGFVRGTFTNSWIARAQTDGYIDGRQRSFKHYSDVTHWWDDMCTKHHNGTCPPFERPDFSLDPDPKTHPSSQPCTRVDPNVLVAAGVKIGPSSPTASLSSISSASSLSSSSSSSSTSSGTNPTPGGSHIFRAGGPAPIAAPIAAGSPFSAPAVKKEPLGSPFRASTKKEELNSPALYLNPPGRVITADTRIQLTPLGAARGAHLHAAAAAGHAAAAANAAALAGATPDHAGHSPSPEPTPILRRASPIRRAEGTPVRRAGLNAPQLSVVATPAMAPAAEAAGRPTPERLYGIRGVGVFYPTHEAAAAAAGALGLTNARIMVSSNIPKLEAWMLGQPFAGEES